MIWRWPAFKRTRLASPSGRRRSPATILPAACSSSLKRLCPCTRASISALGAGGAALSSEQMSSK